MIALSDTGPSTVQNSLQVFTKALILFAASGLAFAQSPNQLVTLRHWTGEGVSPVYEGYDVNPDGSFNMWFGYMNRNYEEEPDIPVGPNNTFDPGGDRGQPTHFSIRRNKDIFAVVVPKDFGDRNSSGPSASTTRPRRLPRRSTGSG